MTYSLTAPQQKRIIYSLHSQNHTMAYQIINFLLSELYSSSQYWSYLAYSMRMFLLLEPFENSVALKLKYA